MAGAGRRGGVVAAALLVAFGLGAGPLLAGCQPEAPPPAPEAAEPALPAVTAAPEAAEPALPAVTAAPEAAEPAPNDVTEAPPPEPDAAAAVEPAPGADAAAEGPPTRPTAEACADACANVLRLTLAELPAGSPETMRQAIRATVERDCPPRCVDKATPEGVACVRRATHARDIAKCPF